MPRGVKIEELKLGEGQVALKNTTARIRYDWSLSRGDVIQQGIELSVDLFRREVIAGLRYGVTGMQVGGRRRVRVSPHLGYGECGVPGMIPPNAVLIFDIELLEVTSHPSTEEHPIED